MTDSQTVELEFRVLTGVHIGSGDEIGPLEYLMFAGSNGPIDEPCMARFRTATLVKHLNQQGRTKLIDLIDSGDQIKVRAQFARMVKDLHDKRPIVDYWAAATPSVAARYLDNIEALRNQLLVRPVLRSGLSYQPLLPGSSLKGALRTAILQRHADKQPGVVRDAQQRQRLDERRLLSYQGSAQSDPFRALTVVDAPITGTRPTIVCDATLWNPQKDEQSSPDMALEVLRGELMGGGAQASVRLTINNEPFTAARRSRIEHFEAPGVRIELRDALEAAHEFYKGVFEAELRQFYLSVFDGAYRDAAMELSDIVDQLNPGNEFLVRIGRHSHKEFMTLHEQSPTFGRSRTLLEYQGRFFPAGWAVLRLKNGDALDLSNSSAVSTPRQGTQRIARLKKGS